MLDLKEQEFRNATWDRRLSCIDPQRGFMGHTAPCRRCIRCLRLRQREWANRILWEATSHTNIWWVRLSYAGQREPGYGEVQKWLKRVRKHVSLRYCIAEERGDDRGRLHWHAFLFGNTDLTRRVWHSEWRLGHIWARSAKSPGAGFYIAKYATKAGRLRASTNLGYQAFERDYAAHLGECLLAFPEMRIKHVIPNSSHHPLCAGLPLWVPKKWLKRAHQTNATGTRDRLSHSRTSRGYNRPPTQGYF